MKYTDETRRHHKRAILLRFSVLETERASQMTWWKPLVLALVFGTIFATHSAAQTGRLTGVVRDETGEEIRGAIVVTETADASSIRQTTATDERGRFFLLFTRSGVWNLTVESPGFEAVKLRIPLKIGAQTPTIEVRLDRRYETPEAFGALAGVDSKGLGQQLTAAGALMDSGQYDQAIAAYRDIKTRLPVMTSVSIQLGKAYVGKKSYTEAEAAFQELLKLNAEDADGCYGMGTLREAQGRPSEAVDWYKKAAASDVLWTTPLLKLAVIARTSGDRDSALRYVTRVLELDPTSPDATQARALQKQLQ